MSAIQECEARTAKCPPAFDAARAEIAHIADLADRMLLQYKGSKNLVSQWPSSNYRTRALSETEKRLADVHNLITSTTWGSTNLQNLWAKYEGSAVFNPARQEPAPPKGDVMIQTVPNTLDLKALAELLPQVAASLEEEYAAQAPLHNRWAICIRTVVDSAKQGLEPPNCWEAAAGGTRWWIWLLLIAAAVGLWWFFFRK